MLSGVFFCVLRFEKWKLESMLLNRRAFGKQADGSAVAGWLVLPTTRSILANRLCLCSLSRLR